MILESEQANLGQQLQKEFSHLWRGQSCVNISKKTQNISKKYNELNDDDTNDDTDGVDVDEMINDLEQTSAKLIDDISIFDTNNGVPDWSTKANVEINVNIFQAKKSEERADFKETYSISTSLQKKKLKTHKFCKVKDAETLFLAGFSMIISVSIFEKKKQSSKFLI
ncbi:hypothetical protein C1646_768712 [Rhizophagus diaphanus]|nr:hypothetical protein C1646_768712 [Rhizophagus diaphanus] [Rhizophagus sp. MUCL 43196]